MVAQYVYLVIYLDESEQLDPFVEQFDLTEDDLAAPMLYLTTAEGQFISTKLGLPGGDELPTLLRDGLKKAAAAAEAE